MATPAKKKSTAAASNSKDDSNSAGSGGGGTSSGKSPGPQKAAMWLRLTKLNNELMAQFPVDRAQHNIPEATRILQELKSMRPIPTAFQLCKSFVLLNTVKRVKEYPYDQDVRDLAMYLWNMYKHICINTASVEEMELMNKEKPPKKVSPGRKRKTPCESGNESTSTGGGSGNSKDSTTAAATTGGDQASTSPTPEPQKQAADSTTPETRPLKTDKDLPVATAPVVESSKPAAQPPPEMDKTAAEPSSTTTTESAVVKESTDEKPQPTATV